MLTKEQQTAAEQTLKSVRRVERLLRMASESCGQMDYDILVNWFKIEDQQMPPAGWLARDIKKALESVGQQAWVLGRTIEARTIMMEK